MNLTFDFIPVLAYTGAVWDGLDLHLLKNVGSSASLRGSSEPNHGDIFSVRWVVDGSVQSDGFLLHWLVQLEDDEVVCRSCSIVVVIGMGDLTNNGAFRCIIQVVEIVWCDNHGTCRAGDVTMSSR